MPALPRTHTLTLTGPLEWEWTPGAPAQDAIHFHTLLKAACDRHDPAYYTDFKQWCDKYFYLSHRQEARGIGGIFFDDLATANPEQTFDFIRSGARGLEQRAPASGPPAHRICADARAGPGRTPEP